MSESLLPPPAKTPWQDKPIQFHDPHKAKRSGLTAFLDALRRLSYVVCLRTIADHASMVVSADFLADPLDPSAIVGWYSHFGDQSTTRFEMQTTACTSAQQQAVLNDLRKRLLDW